MPRYQYSPLSRKPGVIRLLRLLPSKDDSKDLRCELFDYDLRESDKATHPYEALSYVWGNLEKSWPIILENRTLLVTHNLYLALSYLQEYQFPRIIWADAVCINQTDDVEKEHQIQSMAEIYTKANRVIVWLGEAQDNSDQALEAIRIRGEKSTKPSNVENFQPAIQRLLQRQWFRRMWVLQEVAAARQVLMICGSVEIDGHAFCLGLESSGTTLEESRYLVTYLIRGAIFRAIRIPRHLGRFSLDICILGELIDMYHIYEATKCHDKVYALLGMSSDDLSKAGLEPNYTLPWKTLMYRLVKYLLGDQVIVETWDNKEMAVIESRGCALGYVSSVTATQDGRRNIQITFGNTEENPPQGKVRKACWSLVNSAKSVQNRDILCLLQGAINPTIVRPCDGYFTVIMISIIPRVAEGVESENVEWRDIFQLKAEFSRNFFLVWDWENNSIIPQISTVSGISRQIQGQPMKGLNSELDRRRRLRSVELILLDAHEYVCVTDRLQDEIKQYRRTFGKEHLATLEFTEDLATVFKKAHQWVEAATSLLEILQSRKRVQGEEHQSTLNSLAVLISNYRGLGYLEGIETLQVIRDFDSRKENTAKVTIEQLMYVARYSRGPVMSLLLDQKRDEIRITQEIMLEAMRNKQYSSEMIQLLLGRGDRSWITETSIEAYV